MVGTTEEYTQSIRSAYPTLEIRQASLNYRGVHNDILTVNDDLFFRFPRTDAAIQCLAIELDLLSIVRTWLPVPIPVPQFRNLNTKLGRPAFIGYPRLRGEPLFPATLAAITDQRAVRRLAIALMAALRALHGVPIRRLVRYQVPLACGLSTMSWRSGWQHHCNELIAIVAPHLDTATRLALTTQAASFVRALPDDIGATTLIHGDFATGNVLVDHDTHMLTAVIDFGSAGRGDPAHDVATLLVYGERFVADGLAAYPEIKPALDRARLYFRMFLVHDACKAIERGDQTGFEHYINRWKRCSELD